MYLFLFSLWASVEFIVLWVSRWCISSAADIMLYLAGKLSIPIEPDLLNAPCLLHSLNPHELDVI